MEEKEISLATAAMLVLFFAGLTFILYVAQSGPSLEMKGKNLQFYEFLCDDLQLDPWTSQIRCSPTGECLYLGDEYVGTIKARCNDATCELL